MVACLAVRLLLWLAGPNSGTTPWWLRPSQIDHLIALQSSAHLEEFCIFGVVRLRVRVLPVLCLGTGEDQFPHSIHGLFRNNHSRGHRVFPGRARSSCKRSFRRAQRRPAAHGYATYRGRAIVREPALSKPPAAVTSLQPAWPVPWPSSASGNSRLLTLRRIELSPVYGLDASGLTIPCQQELIRTCISDALNPTCRTTCAERGHRTLMSILPKRGRDKHESDNCSFCSSQRQTFFIPDHMNSTLSTLSLFAGFAQSCWFGPPSPVSTLSTCLQ